MESKIYVIGHVNPDTDSIASAMGYAWLLRERDGSNTVAARAGALNPQTAWLLKHLNLEAPTLLTDASPRFESVMIRLDSIRPDAQLGAAWTLASRTGGLAPVVDEDGNPLGELVEILETGANDVYVVRDDSGRELLLPAIPSVILDLDTGRRLMKVHLLEGL